MASTTHTKGQVCIYIFRSHDLLPELRPATVYSRLHNAAHIHSRISSRSDRKSGIPPSSHSLLSTFSWFIAMTLVLQ